MLEFRKYFYRKVKPSHAGYGLCFEPVSRKYGLERGKPIDRHYIDIFLEQNAKNIRGRVVEVSEASYSKKYGKDIESITVLTQDPRSRYPWKSLDANVLFADLGEPETLPHETFDCFICTQTLNFIYDVRTAVSSARRILKPGGVFIGTVAGICQISRYDMDRWGDFWRFSSRAINTVLTEAFGESVSVVSFGNLLAAQAFLIGLAVEDLPNAAVLDPTDKDYEVVLGFIARKLA